MCLYASDHSAACKPSILYFKWLSLEMEEYYQQGDLELKLDFTVTPFFDRTTCNPFKFQLGYIEVVVHPLMITWAEFKTDYNEDLIVKGLNENKKFIQAKFDETQIILKDSQQQMKEQQAE